MNLVDVIDIIGISQGLLLGSLILFGRSKGSMSGVYLGFYLLFISLNTMSSVFENQNLQINYPALYYLPFNFYFVFPILLYLYTREVSGIPQTKIRWIWFVPGMAEFLIYFLLMVGVFMGGPIDQETDAFILLEGVYYLLSFFFMLYFLIKIIRYITKVRREVENNYSNLENKTLYWIRVSCLLILSLFVFGFAEIIVPGLESWFLYAEATVNTGTILWLAIHGYRQTIVLNLNNGLKTENVVLDAPKHVLKESEEDKIAFDEVKQKVLDLQLYKQQELTLNEMAEEIGLHSKRLSYLINEYAGKNFFNFINELRVREAQQLLINDSFAHLSFLGIAFESGFNSKATFNAAFKKVTGETPRQYKTSVQPVGSP